MITLTSALIWFICLMLTIIAALWIRSSIYLLDPHATYLAVHWKIPNKERSDKINSLHKLTNKFFMSLRIWENFVLLDRALHKLVYYPKKIYTKKKGKTVDDAILDGIKLTFYFKYPDDFDNLERFYIVGGFHTPEGSIFGYRDCLKIQEFTFEFVETIVRDLGQDHDWQELHNKRQVMVQYIFDNINDNGGIFNRIGIDIDRVELSHPDLPQSLADVIHAGAVARQKGEAEEIEAHYKAKARKKLYAVDSKNLTEAGLRAMRDKDKLIIVDGASSLATGMIGKIINHVGGAE